MPHSGKSGLDRVLCVASGLRVLTFLLFDAQLDAGGVDGVCSLCELMADELDRVQADQPN